MQVWQVKATTREDEAALSEVWEVRAASVADAVREVEALLAARPDRVEVRRSAATRTAPLAPGQARRIA
jgi:hypothetical protein